MAHTSLPGILKLLPLLRQSWLTHRSHSAEKPNLWSSKLRPAVNGQAARTRRIDPTCTASNPQDWERKNRSIMHCSSNLLVSTCWLSLQVDSPATPQASTSQWVSAQAPLKKSKPSLPDTEADTGVYSWGIQCPKESAKYNILEPAMATSLCLRQRPGILWEFAS